MESPPPPPPLPSFQVPPPPPSSPAMMSQSTDSRPIDFTSELRKRASEQFRRQQYRPTSRGDVVWYAKTIDRDCVSADRSEADQIISTLDQVDRVYDSKDDCEQARRDKLLIEGVMGKLDKHLGDSDPEAFMEIRKELLTYPIEWFRSFNDQVMDHPLADQLMVRKTVKQTIPPPGYRERMAELEAQRNREGSPQVRRQINEMIDDLNASVRTVETETVVEDPRIRNQIEEEIFYGIIGKLTPLEECNERLQEALTLLGLDETSDEYAQRREELLNDIVESDALPESPYSQPQLQQSEIIRRLERQVADLQSRLNANIDNQLRGRPLEAPKSTFREMAEDWIARKVAENISGYTPSPII